MSIEKAKIYFASDLKEFIAIMENDPLDVEKLKAKSHQIKGGAGMLGYKDLHESSAELEVICRGGDVSQIKNVTSKVKKVVLEWLDSYTA